MTVLDLFSRSSDTPDDSHHPPLGGEAIAGFELAALLSSSTYLGMGIPRGNGRMVMVIPGFLGNDEYLGLLRGWLQRIGYSPRASGIVFNVGTPSTLIANLERRIEYLSQHRPGRMVVVGHSLGGVFARALAVTRPDLIAHAICLGSPLGPNPRRSSHPFVAGLGDLLLSERGGAAANRAFEQGLLDAPLPASVHLTSIYTKSDGVVSWRSCIDADPRARAIEVRGTHTGLAWNVQVYRVLGPLLATSPA